MSAKSKKAPLAADDTAQSAALPADASDQRRAAEKRQAAGKAARAVAARAGQATWSPPPDRLDPVATLAAQDDARLPDLVPIRYGRMAASPLAFYRGAAAIMAADLATTPACGIRTQLCGDAHLANFGLYASPERSLLFDLNDFDETLPGPFEWDLKRLAASFAVAGRSNGFSAAVCREAALAAACSYREHMTAYAAMPDLEVWYARVSAADALAMIRRTTGIKKKSSERDIARARRRDSLQAQGQLTAIVDGQRRIIDDPPLISHCDTGNGTEAAHVNAAFDAYRHTLEDDRRVLIERFTLLDFARDVVGVGSVGRRCFIGLFKGCDDNDPLFLQIKEAGTSVLEPFAGPSIYRNKAHRVVAGQRLMQAASDIFLGWIRDSDGRDYYWRQLRDMKGSVVIDEIAQPAGLSMYAEFCGWALARAHARGGDRIAIAAYLGTSDRFDHALADFAAAYADQTERDYKILVQAIAAGRVNAETGV
ncbi:MAG: DUF2252 domain-containing protein [Thermoleophilia bacterium]